MKNSIKGIIVLVSICAVMSVLLSFVNGITYQQIIDNQNRDANDAIKVIFPEAAGISSEAIELAEYEGKIPTSVIQADKYGDVGFVIRISTTGYKPGLIILFAVRADGTIAGAQVIDSKETNGAEKTYGELFKDQTLEGIDAIDTVSGSTFTTKAYKQAAKDALNAMTVLSGGEADLRTEEEKFADNLKAALAIEEGQFEKVFIVEQGIEKFDAIYVEKTSKGYVFIKDSTFIGIDAQGTAIKEPPENAALTEQAKNELQIILATKMESLDLTTYQGISKIVQSVQKTATGNYVLDLRGEGYAINGAGKEHEYLTGVPIMIRISMTPDGKIIDCMTVSHGESKGYGDKCATEEYCGQYDGKTKDEIDTIAISGATATSTGYKKAVLTAFEAVSIIEGGVTNEEQQ